MKYMDQPPNAASGTHQHEGFPAVDVRGAAHRGREQEGEDGCGDEARARCPGHCLCMFWGAQE